jgi:hypothetical protein
MSPVGKDKTHSPPDARTTRSLKAGPKNQTVNASQEAVPTNHLNIPSLVLEFEGLVSHEKKKTADVHAQAFLMK